MSIRLPSHAARSVSGAALVAAALLPGAAALAQQTSRPIRGFPTDALAAQSRREAQLRAVPSADSLRERMRLLAAEPHEAGTDRSRRVAELILERFKSFGLDAQIEKFEALMPRPISRTVQLVAPTRFTASLKEPPLPQDPDSHDEHQIPTYNAFSPDGDVTAPLVFVNYGLPDDYRVLDSLGVDVKGKIVIAKYGRSWRGIKPKLAAEHGAVACIIYSEPEEDGYFVEDVYPVGPMRPPRGAQRGSVMDMPTYPGDPLSPGWASVPGARKLGVQQVKTFSPIPVIPIGYGDALPLLRSLRGPVAPEPWRGVLPLTYHVGPGPGRVRVALEFEWKTRPLYNVIARVKGARSPDQWIVHGNHHDAWVNGADDPISGMVAVEETARAVGALLKTGWRPARTLIFAAWDGEEWGLLGSTEWVERHRDELQKSALAYLNSDSNDRGWLSVGGSHSLQAFMAEVARDIRDPNTGRSALDVALEKRREAEKKASSPDSTKPDTAGRCECPQPDSVQGDSAHAASRQPHSTPRPRPGSTPAPSRADTLFAIDALGSGSDYTAFLDHAGLPTLNISHGGEASSGIYHSIYDTFTFYTRFLDTTFAYGVAQSQTVGTVLLRLAEAPVLPFEFGNVVRTYRKYVDEIEKAARKNDTTKALDLAPVRAALDRLDASAQRYEAALAPLADLPASSLRRRWSRLAAVNTMLYRTEQALADPQGLPGREWYKHLIYAPGFYTGYGVKTMPGIREAVEDRPNAAVAQRQATRVAAAIDRMAKQVTQAADALEKALR